MDIVTVQGSPAADTIAVATNGGAPLVSGLAATVRIGHPDLTDQLIVNGGAGLDAITVDPGLPGIMAVIVNQD
jgi:hypothetical protein